MFANKRTERLTGRLKYEIISITVMSGSKTIGTPLGTNSFKYPKPCFKKPIIVTATKIKIANKSVTIIGFMKHGFGYLKLFVPSGVPVVLLPLITVIEIISYLSRPVSLSVRLFANMMAGHTMMKVFGGFVISLGIVGGWLPLSFSVALTGLEILVAFLQAYVFAILTCIYLNDALNLHH